MSEGMEGVISASASVHHGPGPCSGEEEDSNSSSTATSAEEDLPRAPEAEPEPQGPSATSTGTLTRRDRNSYCQFETPADESRGTFPDDLDEDLFLNMEGAERPRGQDTAEHSESSDIEELFGGRRVAPPPEIGVSTPTSSRSGLPLLVRSGARCLLVDEGYSQEDGEEGDEDFPNHTCHASNRKRKYSVEEALPGPAKKAVTTEGTENEESCGSSRRIPDHECGLVPMEEDEEEEGSVASSPENPELSAWLNTFVSWTSQERMAAINNLIHISDPVEVRHMMRTIEPQFQRDFISLLPKELALYVLSFLEPKDLLQAAQTCKNWRVLCDDSLLWKEKCREAGVGPFSAMSARIHNRRGRGAPTLQGLLGAGRTCPSAGDNNCIASCEPWKAAFLRQHNVEMNWRFQPIRPAKTLKGHDDHVITCLQFSSNRIVSGSDDNTLKVWSATTGKCLRTLVGHTGGVWSSQMSGTTIVSGSTDRTLRVWNADTGACLHTLYGHTSTVRCMHLYERKVVSGSRDATLRVWDVDSGECLHVLVGHLAAVRCVQYNGKIVVSGAYDFMVRVWDVEREECLHQLSGHTNRVYSLQFDGIHVVSGSLDTSIRVWDVRTGACRHTLMGHQSLTSGMELRDNLLVSGNADSTVKIWDINTGQCLLTLSGANKHLSAVTCLQLINKFVITSSDDGTVKLWDLATGEFVRNLVTLASGGSGGVVWRIRASETKLVCAVGSRNGTEETKLLVLDFDVDSGKEDGKKDASTSTSPIKGQVG